MIPVYKQSARKSNQTNQTQIYIAPYTASEPEVLGLGSGAGLGWSLAGAGDCKSSTRR